MWFHTCQIIKATWLHASIPNDRVPKELRHHLSWCGTVTGNHTRLSDAYLTVIRCLSDAYLTATATCFLWLAIQKSPKLFQTFDPLCQPWGFPLNSWFMVARGCGENSSPFDLFFFWKPLDPTGFWGKGAPYYFGLFGDALDYFGLFWDAPCYFGLFWEARPPLKQTFAGNITIYLYQNHASDRRRIGVR